MTRDFHHLIAPVRFSQLEHGFNIMQGDDIPKQAIYWPKPSPLQLIDQLQCRIFGHVHKTQVVDPTIFTVACGEGCALGVQVLQR